MSKRFSLLHNRAVLVAGLILALMVVLVAAYIFSGESNENETANGQTPVTLFLSYVPNVQFAPLYVAAQRGYFADEGIAITFENSFNEADGVERLATNNLQFGLISGEQVVLARGSDRPVVYVFEWYHRFPVGVVSRADLNITQPADLRGRVVGIPGEYGASYIGLRALLEAGGLTQSDLGELRSIGFTAVENVCTSQVDAAVVYIVNEPLTIEEQCFPVNVIEVSDYATLISNGLVTNEDTIRNKPDLVRGMVRAIQRGLLDTIADPDTAFDISVTHYVTDLSQDDYDTQRQVLYNSVALWRSDDLGRTTPEAWDATQSMLVEYRTAVRPARRSSAAAMT